MPVSPNPGRGISTAGIDKSSGWTTGPNQGIDPISGLSEDGLDVGTVPLTVPAATTGLVPTGAVINWATAPASPPGSVKQRLSGSGGAYSAPVTEAAGNKTTHTVPLTGLTASTAYEYVVSQPSPTAGGVTVEYTGRITTPAV